MLINIQHGGNKRGLLLDGLVVVHLLPILRNKRKYLFFEKMQQERTKSQK
jgi:hypothetical protein